MAIRENIPPGKRRVSDKEIADAVTKAAREHLGTPFRWTGQRWHNPRPVKPFNAPAFMKRLLAESDGIGEADVWEASPIRLDWPPEQDTVQLLARLYDPADVLFIGERDDTAVKPVAEWMTDCQAGQQIPPHFIPNPVTGKLGLTKDGKPSLRADDCVKCFRFAVAEFDELPREDQLKFWWAVNLPVCALIDAGGKSIHALIRIDEVLTADQWTDLVEDKLFGHYLIPLGCDGACKNEARLSRLPGHFRGEKGRWQRILYLAPEGRRVNP